MIYVKPVQFANKKKIERLYFIFIRVFDKLYL